MATAIGNPARSELTSLQKTLIGIVGLYVLSVPVFWYLEMQLNVSHHVASNAMTIVHILCFGSALLTPWLPLRGQKSCDRSQRLDKMVIVWIFICLTPRIMFELPWLFFLDEIRRGVESGALWSYSWSPYLLGGDARYYNGDPLIVTLEAIALFVGAFEGWALWRFFAQGKRFTNLQLSLIMGGMIVEVILPAVYFGMAIVSPAATAASSTDLWIKFILLNSFWCTMPLVTYFWGVRRLARQDLAVVF